MLFQAMQLLAEGFPLGLVGTLNNQLILFVALLVARRAQSHLAHAVLPKIELALRRNKCHVKLIVVILVDASLAGAVALS